METENRGGAPVQSVGRAITVMEILARQGWSGVTEVAKELDTHKSTAYRLLSTLKDRGLVEQDASSEKYRLGFGLVMLASFVTADLDVARSSKEACDWLADRTGETVTVAVLEGDDAVTVHQSSLGNSVLSVDWSGSHTPLHATAAGKVLLNYMPEDQRTRVIEGPNERYTESTFVDARLLRENLASCLDNGYWHTTEELEVGLNAVAAPVFDSAGEVVAAVSVSGPVFRMEPESFEEAGNLTKEAAADISRRLGFQGG